MEQEIGFRIEVRGARNVMPMDPNGQSDPYCVIGLADPTTNAFLDPSTVLRSKTHFVTLNPVWKGFSLVSKSPEHKIRIEVWDKDQAETDDFEGLAIVDPVALTEASNSVDLWLPLAGRSESEQVTGDVNVVIQKGPIQELESRIGVSDSTVKAQDVERLVSDKKDDESTIKKLQSALKTKGGKMEQLKENYSVLDMKFVKALGQVDQLQAEIAAKHAQLAAQADDLAKAKSYAVELQQALQEKQKVSILVKEWNDNAQMLDRLHAQLKATSTRHKKGVNNQSGEGEVVQVEEKVPAKAVSVVSERPETEWLSVGKVMEQMNEYTSLIEVLEVDLKEKTDQLEKSKIEKELQLTDTAQQIASLQTELSTKAGEIEKQRVWQLEQAEKLQVSLEMVEQLKLELQAKDKLLISTHEQETQLKDAREQVEALFVEIKVKSNEINEQTIQIEKYKEDARAIVEVQEALHQKEDELLELTNIKIEIEEKLHQQAKVLESAEFELTTKSHKLQVLETELEELKVHISTEKQIEVTQLQDELMKQTRKVEELSAAEIQLESENNALLSRNEELQDEKTSLETRVSELMQQLRLRTEECSKIEEEVKQVKQMLEDERDSAKKSKPLIPDEDEVVVVRAKKRVQDQEVVTLGGGSQFSAHAKPLDEEPTTTKGRAEREGEAEADAAQLRAKQYQEEHGSNKDLLGVQLDELERIDEELSAAARAGTTPLLEGSLPVLPTTREATRVLANKKRSCCFSG